MRRRVNNVELFKKGQEVSIREDDGGLWYGVIEGVDVESKTCLVKGNEVFHSVNFDDIRPMWSKMNILPSFKDSDKSSFNENNDTVIGKDFYEELTYVSSDEWCGVYINERLMYEGHNISTHYWLNLINQAYFSKVTEIKLSASFDEIGSLPLFINELEAKYIEFKATMPIGDDR